MSDDRKYRQRGYHDSDRGAQRSRGPMPPREKKEGPRGRGLGAPTESAFRCAQCNEKRPLFEELTVDASCGKCNAALHTCANCIHFDTSTRWECRQVESLPARVAKKRDRNECAFFTPKTVQEFGKESEKAAPGDARSAFDALFKF